MLDKKRIGLIGVVLLTVITVGVGVYALNTSGSVLDSDYEPDSIIIEYAEEVPLSEDKIVDYSSFNDFQEYRYYRGTSSVNITVLLTRYGDGLYLIKNIFDCGETSESVKALSAVDAENILNLLKGYKVSTPQTDVEDGSEVEYAGIVINGNYSVIEPINLSSIGLEI